MSSRHSLLVPVLSESNHESRLPLPACSRHILCCLFGHCCSCGQRYQGGKRHLCVDTRTMKRNTIRVVLHSIILLAPAATSRRLPMSADLLMNGDTCQAGSDKVPFSEVLDGVEAEPWYTHRRQYHCGSWHYATFLLASFSFQSCQVASTLGLGVRLVASSGALSRYPFVGPSSRTPCTVPPSISWGLRGVQPRCATKNTFIFVMSPCRALVCIVAQITVAERVVVTLRGNS